MYITLEEAKKEIWVRWNDVTLRKKAEDFIGEVPGILGKEPAAILWRNIATPDIEFLHFLDRVKHINLKPLVLEYLTDKLCTSNSSKLGLGKMAFYHGKNKNGKTVFHYKKVIDFIRSDGKPFFEINTLWGENFVDFHHRILEPNSSGVGILDMSSWLRKKGQKAKEYYPYVLGLFVRNGILFENFSIDGNPRESKFTDEIVMPALEKVKEHFGVKPLIVQLVPQHEISDRYWWCYPDYIEKEIPKEWV